jgi:hypothetical protein
MAPAADLASQLSYFSYPANQLSPHSLFVVVNDGSNFFKGFIKIILQCKISIL